MNSLGSWIDKKELDRLVAAVGTKTEEVTPSQTAPQKSAKGSPLPWKRPLDLASTPPVGSSSSPESQIADPPAPERFPVAEEVEKFRDKVAAIKDKARALGVLTPGQPQQSADDSAGTGTGYAVPARAAKVKSTALAGHPVTAKSAHPKFRAPQGPLRLRLECFGEWAATITHAQAVIVADSHGDLVFERGANPSWVSSVSMVASAGERAGRNLSISGNTLIHLDLPADRKLAVLPCQTNFGHLSVGLVVPRSLTPDSARAITDAIAAVIARS